MSWIKSIIGDVTHRKASVTASANSVASDPKNTIDITDRSIDLESLSSGEAAHVFQDPIIAEHYRDLYESVGYEGKHLFDPQFTWDPKEERKVLWKNDWYVTFWAFIMFTSVNFDRGNLLQALSDTFLKDLKMTTNQLNIGMTINLVCFLFAEIPMQLISKWVGADVWIPIQMCLFSGITIGQAAMHDYKAFYATRALLGLFQGGFICDVCLWLSYFFTSKELPIRLLLFYISNPMTKVWLSLLAFALLKIKTKAFPAGWRWLFIVEGTMTLLIGIIAFFKMPASASQTKSKYRKDGWYTDREEKILVNKILRDDPNKGGMHNREPIKAKDLFKAIFDYDMLPIYVFRLFGDICTAPIANYLQIVLRRMGFSTFQTNALTIPYNILIVMSMMTTAFVSDKLDSKALVLLSIPIWVLSCLFPLRFWPKAQVDIWGTFILLTIVLGVCPTWPISISWCLANSNSVRRRTVSAAVVNVFSQCGAIIASNVYVASDAPLYHRGNEILIGCSFATLFSLLIARYYFIWRNNRRDAIWQTMTEDEKTNYTKSTTDEGNKRLDFRFVY